MSEMEKALETSFIPNSSCSSHMRSTISINSVPHKTQACYTRIHFSIHYEIFSYIGFWDCAITSLTPKTIYYQQQIVVVLYPTPMTLASGGSPIFPLVVYPSASPSIWPAVLSFRQGMFTNIGATMWCVCGCS